VTSSTLLHRSLCPGWPPVQQPTPADPLYFVPLPLLQESFDSLEACALAWQQRAQRQRAFARSPQLLRFADMPRLLFWVGQGSPGALDLLQQVGM